MEQLLPDNLWNVFSYLFIGGVIPYLLLKLFIGISLPKRKPLQFFDRESRKFELLRRSTFPPPFPNGWWKVCDISDLNNGRIQTVSALGQELVVFKGSDGKIGVFDAFCPHIGAHLKDGEVIGNTLSCPYHGWKFDSTGQCVEIPYCTGSIPSTAKAKTWTSCIWLDMVFVWFDAEGRPPGYELIKHSYFLNGSYSLFSVSQSWFDMHISEMAENSPDYFHFNYLHRTLPVPLIGKYFIVKHETQLYFPEDKPMKHISYFDNFAEIWPFDKFRIAASRQKTVVTFEGPSIVHFQIETPLGGVHLYKTLLPVEPFKLYTEDRWYVEDKTPRWLAWIVSNVAKGALEQDRTVWQNKTYHSKPHLVKGDGPWPSHRRWWSQFYSENSNKVGKQNLREVLDW
jgi:cholesterol 7-dehydrogenase